MYVAASVCDRKVVILGWVTSELPDSSYFLLLPMLLSFAPPTPICSCNLLTVEIIPYSLIFAIKVGFKVLFEVSPFQNLKF